MKPPEAFLAAGEGSQTRHLGMGRKVNVTALTTSGGHRGLQAPG